jgi:hypothetical protein
MCTVPTPLNPEEPNYDDETIPPVLKEEDPDMQYSQLKIKLQTSAEPLQDLL